MAFLENEERSADFPLLITSLNGELTRGSWQGILISKGFDYKE